MRRLMMIVSALCLLLTARPVHAQGMDEANLPEASYQQLVRDASQMLTTVAQQQDVRIQLALHGSNAVATEARDRVRERIVNLVANALVSAPKHSVLKVTLDADTYTLRVEVPNQGTAMTTQRDIVDGVGGVFHLNSKQGVGVSLEASLQDAPLTRADAP